MVVVVLCGGDCALTASRQGTDIVRGSEGGKGKGENENPGEGLGG